MQGRDHPAPMLGAARGGPLAAGPGVRSQGQARACLTVPDLGLSGLGLRRPAPASHCPPVQLPGPPSSSGCAAWPLGVSGVLAALPVLLWGLVAAKWACEHHHPPAHQQRPAGCCSGGGLAPQRPVTAGAALHWTGAAYCCCCWRPCVVAARRTPCGCPCSAAGGKTWPACCGWWPALQRQLHLLPPEFDYPLGSAGLHLWEPARLTSCSADAKTQPGERPPLME